MAIILDGKESSLELKEELKEKIAKLNDKLKLVVIMIGDNEGSKIYVRNKRLLAEDLGIDFELIHYDDTVSESDVINKIKDLNVNDKVHGIMVQMPIPVKYDKKRILETICWYKDVDGMSSINLGNVIIGNKCPVSCTPKGIVYLLKKYDIKIDGKHVVIVGRSDIVGKPMSMLMLRENATVTICHSKTEDLSFYTKQADILIVAVGYKHLITEDMIKDNVIIIDVGINRGEGKKIYGDVDYDSVYNKASYITPVPGGVGPMTVVMLMDNLYDCYELVKKSKN